MLRQYFAQRSMGGANPLRVGTIAIGSIYYLQDDGWWRDRYRGRSQCRHPWIVESFLPAIMGAARRDPETGHWQSLHVAHFCDTALVRSLRNGRLRRVQIRVLQVHGDGALARADPLPRASLGPFRRSLSPATGMREMTPQPSATHSTRPRKPDRLLILACSQCKRPDPGHIPAIERYDGPLWQTLRSIDPHGEAAQVAFLSALYGLRDARWAEVPAYNLLLTDQLAEKMIRGGVETRWPRPSSPRLPDTAGVHPASEIASMAHACGGVFRDVALVGGHRYIRVLQAWLPAFAREGWISKTMRLCVINAPIGIMRQKLRVWTLEAPCSSI